MHDIVLCGAHLKFNKCHGKSFLLFDCEVTEVRMFAQLGTYIGFVDAISISPFRKKVFFNSKYVV